MKVVIAGGGTAGHAYPGIALAGVLRERDVEVLFVGTARGPEARLAAQKGFAFEPVEVLGRKKGVNLHNLKALATLAGAIRRSIVLLAQTGPDAVVGTGGYVSLPVTLAAALHRIPLVIHEQNTVPGLANRIASRFAAAIAVSFPGTEARLHPRARLVGNPVRPEIAKLDRESSRLQAIEEFGLDPARRTILFAGGSQGACSINKAALSLYDRWRASDQIQVLHLTGKRHIEGIQQKIESLKTPSDRIIWKTFAYTDRMDLAYAIADLAICRSGATTIAELAAASVPAILVPFPHSMDNDQLHNAEAATQAGAAEMILDKDLNPANLGTLTERLLADRESLFRMKESMSSLAIPDAAQRLADLVAAVALGERPAVGPDRRHEGEADSRTEPRALRVSPRARIEPGFDREPAAGRTQSAVPNKLALPWRRVHMVGIGGAGMSAIARVLVQAGIEVSGSDLSDSATLAELVSLGMQVEVGHRAEMVEGADAVIFSAAVDSGNLEVAAARERGIPVISRGEALARIVEGRRTVAVSGTHGKTTTSGMIATVLERAEMDPTYLLGADLSQRGPGGKLGSGEVAVVEADEAYGSFLALRPSVALVLNVDVDHLDYYGTVEGIDEAFARFAAGAQQLIVCADDPGAAKIGHPNRITYGLQEGADVTAAGLTVNVDGSRFDLMVNGSKTAEVTLRIGGRRNAQNALGAAAACIALGIETPAIAAGLSSFRGVSRRFEYRGSYRGADLVDDYAHHPTEIEATLADARSGPWRRIVAVFQPHLYSRTQSLWREFGNALGHADLVVVTDVYAAREDPVPGVTGKMVAEAVCEAEPAKRVAYLPRLGEAAEYVRAEMRPGDLVLSLGAGDVTTFAQRLVEGAP